MLIMICGLFIGVLALFKIYNYKELKKVIMTSEEMTSEDKYKLIEGFILEFKCASMKWTNIDTGEEEPRGVTSEMINGYIRRYNKK